MLMKSIGVFSNEPRNIGAFCSKPVCGKVEGALAGKGRLAQIVHEKKLLRRTGTLKLNCISESISLRHFNN